VRAEKKKVRFDSPIEQPEPEKSSVTERRY
jgi:hypothetical protein